jgi:hypothetical protein
MTIYISDEQPLFCTKANFQTPKPYADGKPSDMNESHV